MPKPVMFIDGKYLAVTPSVLDAFTPGIIQAAGVFETMRGVGGHVEFLDEHVQRMLNGMSILKLPHPYEAKRLKSIARRLMRCNASKATARVRLMLFRQGAHIHCAGTVQRYHPPSRALYRRGVVLKVAVTDRPASARYAQVKSLDYGLYARAYAQARAEGYDDALLLNARGYVMESSRANIFAFVKGRLVTPAVSAGCLNGILRAQIIRCAREMGLHVAEENLTVGVLKQAQGIFLTNSLMGIMPVAAIEE